MKLIEALQHVRRMSEREGEPLAVALACGFTPLHLQTYLTAYLAMFVPLRKIDIRLGLFGDTLGNVERLLDNPVEAAVVTLEWSDIDPRLGLRALSGWRPAELPDIIATTTERLAQLGEGIARAAKLFPVAISLPTLPLPPIAYTPGWLTSGFELELRAILAGFAAKCGQVNGVRIASMQRFDSVSPPSDRLDVKAELLSGYPYTLGHADAVGEMMARLIATSPPKKGLITDLDDTLWRGILGEVGVTGVTWHLDHHSHIHGIYQQMLTSLAETGVLVAVASKNESAIVEEALARRDLIVDASRIFPKEAHWEAKSGSVRRILQAWNIGADAVVFVDDSLMELAEVKAAFPTVECLLFPTHDDAAIYDLLKRLRDLFGKSALSREDTLRLHSLRVAAEAKHEATVAGANVAPDRLLDEARPVLAFSFDKEPFDPRALELVNKTNQFNLNGRRYTEAKWHAHLADPATFLLRAEYEDKFGPLGTIAILGGRVADGVAHLAFWVMSCRAFSRRIEHRSLLEVFDQLNVNAIVFHYEETPRNNLLRDALANLMETKPEPGVCLDRATFARRCPLLPHRIMNWTNA